MCIINKASIPCAVSIASVASIADVPGINSRKSIAYTVGIASVIKAYRVPDAISAAWMADEVSKKREVSIAFAVNLTLLGEVTDIADFDNWDKNRSIIFIKTYKYVLAEKDTYNANGLTAASKSNISTSWKIQATFFLIKTVWKLKRFVLNSIKY